MKHALMIIAKENYRDEELEIPKEILEKNDVEVTIASKKVGECVGKLGGKVEAVIGLNQINVEDFDVVVFVGGGGSEMFFDDISAHLIAKKTVESGKLLCAICASPSILAKAKVLEGKQATVFPSYANILEENGVKNTQSEVEVDGNIITARDSDSAKAFGEKIMEMLVDS